MGSQTAVPKPSTGGDNAMMDAAAASGGSSSSLPTGGDVGLGQSNSLPDVQAVNAALNANGIGTPYGGDIVDTDAIKAGQAKLSEATGIDLKQDGWVGPKTKQAFQLTQLPTAKLPTAKLLSTDRGRPQAEYFAQQNAITKQAKEQVEKLKQRGGQSAQSLGQQAFQAAKAGNPLGGFKPPKIPKVNKSPLATQPAPTTAPKGPARQDPPPFKPLPKVSDEERLENEDTLNYVRKHLRDGVGDLGQTLARAIDDMGQPAMGQVLDLASQYRQVGMNEEADRLLLRTHGGIRTPAYKQAFETYGNANHQGKDVFAAPKDIRADQPDGLDPKLKTQMDRGKSYSEKDIHDQEGGWKDAGKRQGGYKLTGASSKKHLIDDGKIGKYTIRTPNNRPVVNLAKDRDQAILNDSPALFEIQKNPDATSEEMPYEAPQLGYRAVKEHNALIEEVSKKHKLDPDLIRAVMWAENARGHKGGLNDLADKMGYSNSIMPMNINPEAWGKLVGKGKDFYDPKTNVEAAAILLKRIQNRIPNANDAAAIGSIWNFSGMEMTTNFGEYIGRLYSEKPWNQIPPVMGSGPENNVP